MHNKSTTIKKHYQYSPLTAEGKREPMKPCQVLSQIQYELASVAKAKDVPFTRVYKLAPEAEIEISMCMLEETQQYQLEVKSAHSLEKAIDVNFKTLANLLPIFTWRALCPFLTRMQFVPCPTMEHDGADEILALYKCMNSFKENMTLPFLFSVNGPNGPYELFAARQKDNHCEIVFETNYVYGNLMKWSAEVDLVDQAIDRADKMLFNVVGEWLRPDYVKSLRTHS